MGATTIYITTDVPQNQLKDWFRDLQQDAAYKYGSNGYNGSWNQLAGIQVDARRTFYDERDAEEYISAHTDKRGPALAVPFVLRDGPAFEETAEGRKLSIKVEKLRRETSYEFEREVIKRVRQQKSKLKTCRACDSRINTQHIHTRHCPVCRDPGFLFTATDEKRHQRNQARLKEAQAALDAARRRYNQSGNGKRIWYVGGTAPI